MRWVRCLSKGQNGAARLRLYDVPWRLARIPEKKKSSSAAQLVATEYYQAVTHTDISKVDGVAKNPERVKRLMRSYARHQGSQASLATIAGDISSNEVEKLSENTISDYLVALKKIFVVKDAIAWWSLWSDRGKTGRQYRHRRRRSNS